MCMLATTTRCAPSIEGCSGGGVAVAVVWWGSWRVVREALQMDAGGIQHLRYPHFN
jgi:hypothetical protein